MTNAGGHTACLLFFSLSILVALDGCDGWQKENNAYLRRQTAPASQTWELAQKLVSVLEGRDTPERVFQEVRNTGIWHFIDLDGEVAIADRNSVSFLVDDVPLTERAIRQIALHIEKEGSTVLSCAGQDLIHGSTDDIRLVLTHTRKGIVVAPTNRTLR